MKRLLFTLALLVCLVLFPDIASAEAIPVTAGESLAIAPRVKKDRQYDVTVLATDIEGHVTNNAYIYFKAPKKWNFGFKITNIHYEGVGVTESSLQMPVFLGDYDRDEDSFIPRSVNWVSKYSDFYDTELVFLNNETQPEILAPMAMRRGQRLYLQVGYPYDQEGRNLHFTLEVIKQKR